MLGFAYSVVTCRQGSGPAAGSRRRRGSSGADSGHWSTCGPVLKSRCRACTLTVLPLGMAPFIRLTVEGQERGRPALVAEDGMFGLLPHFAAEEQHGRRTYSARSETVHKPPSFRPTWKAHQRCIIPTEAVFEPNYETGKAVRWRISQEGDVPPSASQASIEGGGT